MALVIWRAGQTAKLDQLKRVTEALRSTEALVGVFKSTRRRPVG